MDTQQDPIVPISDVALHTEVAFEALRCAVKGTVSEAVAAELKAAPVLERIRSMEPSVEEMTTELLTLVNDDRAVFAEQVANYVDTDAITDAIISGSNSGESVHDIVVEAIDYDDIASNLCHETIADNICKESLADYIDKQEVADLMSKDIEPDQFDDLKAEMSTLRDDMQATCALVEVLQIQLRDLRILKQTPTKPARRWWLLWLL